MINKLFSYSVLFLVFPFLAYSQYEKENTIVMVSSLDQAVEIAFKNNGLVQNASLHIDAKKMETKALNTFEKTDISFLYGQMNTYANDGNITIGQTVKFPSYYTANEQLGEKITNQAKYNLVSVQNHLRFQISTEWQEIVYLKEVQKLLRQKDSIFTEMVNLTEDQFDSNKVEYLELVTIETQRMEVQNHLDLIGADMAIHKSRLVVLLGTNDSVSIIPSKLTRVNIDSIDTDKLSITNNPHLLVLNEQTAIEEAQQNVYEKEYYPDFSVGYFNQSMVGAELANGGIAGYSDRFQGVAVGLKVPIFYSGYKAKVQQTKIAAEMAANTAQYQERDLQGQFDQQLHKLQILHNSLNYYEEKALVQADIIITNAQTEYAAKQISYIEYFQNIKQALEIKEGYLNVFNQYNHAKITLRYLLGQ